MNQISFFLERFKERFERFEPFDVKIKKSVQMAIFDVLGIEIDLNDISIQKGGIFIKTSPLVRSEILIHYEDIALKIDSNLPVRH